MMKYYLLALALLLGACTAPPPPPLPAGAPSAAIVNPMAHAKPVPQAPTVASGHFLVVGVGNDTVPTGLPQPLPGITVAEDTLPPPRQYTVGSPGVGSPTTVKRNRQTLALEPERVHTTGHDLWEQGPLLDTAALPKLHTEGTPVPSALPTPMPVGDFVPQAAGTHALQQLGEAQQLPDRVTALEHGSRGGLWLSSENTLLYYNGTSALHFGPEQGLQALEISTLQQDAAGNLWIGDISQRAIIKFNGAAFTYFNAAHGLKNLWIHDSYLDHTGALWFGTDNGGAYLYRNNAFQVLELAQGLQAELNRGFAEDTQGRLYIGDFNRVVRYNGERLWYLPLPSAWEVGWVNALACDPAGTLWIGSEKGGLLMYTQDTLVQYTVGQSLLSSPSPISAIQLDSQGQPWLSMLGGGIATITPQGLKTVGLAEGLTGTGLQVTGLLQDAQSRWWLGTEGGGLYAYSPENFKAYTTINGLSNNAITSVAAQQSTAASARELPHAFGAYEPASFTLQTTQYTAQYTAGQGMPNTWDYFVNALLVDATGKAWLGLTNGLATFDGKTYTHIPSTKRLAISEVTDILFEDDKDWWLATNNSGVIHYHNQAYTYYNQEHGLGALRIPSLMKDSKGRLWLGTYGSGAICLDGDSVTHWTTHEGLSSDYVNQCYEDPMGRIWMGTAGGGLMVFDGQRFGQLTTADGLPDDNVWSIMEDAHGTVWLSTDNGLACLVPQAEGQYALKTFGRQEGLKDLGFWANSAGQDAQGTLWWGGVEHLISLDSAGALALANAPDIAPQAEIQAVKLNERTINYHDSLAADSLTYAQVRPFTNVPEGLEVPYSKNHFTFSYSAIDLTAPHRTEYSYVLVGQDSRWSMPTQELKADYRNLRSGSYTFQVVARHAGQAWGPVASVGFRVLPPWWLRWWAFLGYAAGLLGLVQGYVRWQLYQARQREKVLEAQVQERTVQLSESNNALQESYEEVNMKNEEIAAQNELLSDLTTDLQKKNKDMADSIQYAQKIQSAILVSAERMQELLGEHFMLYRPKDVVSGDFYWLEQVNDMVYVAVADCTGHGVPGAMVSVICSNALTKAVIEEQLTDTGAILTRTREIVVARLSISGREVKDGMDISLAAINRQQMTLQWSGAFNPLWLIHAGRAEPVTAPEPKAVKPFGDNNEGFELKADRQPIGLYPAMEPFKTHHVPLLPGDCLYLFSDGFQDQFGGPKFKKYMSKRMKAKFVAIHQEPMATQHQLLVKEFESWLAGTSQRAGHQIDDVSIMGIKI